MILTTVKISFKILLHVNNHIIMFMENPKILINEK